MGLIDHEVELDSLLTKENADLLPVALKCLERRQVEIAHRMLIHQVLCAARLHISAGQDFVGWWPSECFRVFRAPWPKTRRRADDEKGVNLPEGT